MNWWEPGTVAAIVVPAVVWLIRLEGRVNAHDLLFEERRLLETTRHETLIREIGSVRELVVIALQKGVVLKEGQTAKDLPKSSPEPPQPA